MTVKRRRSIEYLGKVRRAVKTGNGVEFDIEGGAARITVHSPEIVRVRAHFGVGDPHGDISYAVETPAPDQSDFTIQETDLEVEIDTGALMVRVDRNPFRVMIFDRSRRLLSADAAWGGVGRRGSKILCDKEISTDEHFYGFGEKAFTTDRRGKKMKMWATDAAMHKWESDPLYISAPFFIGSHSGAAYGMFFDSPWKCTFDMGGTSRTYYTYSADGGDLNYYFIAGPEMKDVLDKYTKLTGRPFMPPMWSLGFQQSRWSYKTDEKVRYIAKRFRELDIPCDVIHLDIHYMDGYRVFTWNDRRFSDPVELVRELNDDGMKIITIIDPGVKIDKDYDLYREGMDNDYFCRKKGGGYFVGIVWPGHTHFPDFARPEVRDWWAGKITKFISETGHAGIWNDMNEPSINIKLHMRRIDSQRMLHRERDLVVPHAKLRNAYGQLEAEATIDGLLAARPTERPFLLTRSGYAGIQKYAAVWSGDNQSTWEHMHLSIPLLCGMGMSGMPFVGADIGGFQGSCTPELFARWIQVGAFYPFSRAHTMMLSRPQQPWSFGQRVTDISREYIKRRYRLLPYIYNAFYIAHKTGAPIMRSLAYEFQHDGPSAVNDNEFMLGPSLLVAPVLEEGAREREVYLPPGGWIDFHTGQHHGGSSSITVNAPLEQMPLFIREGHIIPMIPPASFIGERNPDPLILHIYFGANAGLELYEDDGSSHPAGESFSLTRYEYTEDLTGVTLQSDIIDKGATPFRQNRSSLIIRIHGFRTSPEKVALNGDNMHEAWHADASDDTPFHGWSWDPQERLLSIGMHFTDEPFKLDIPY